MYDVNYLTSSAYKCFVLLERAKAKLLSQARKLHRFKTLFLAVTVKRWQFVISRSDKVHHRNRGVIQQLTAPVETRKLVVTTHFCCVLDGRKTINKFSVL